VSGGLARASLAREEEMSEPAPALFDSPSLGDSIALDRLYRNTGLD
jgi:hypothetical protein